MQVSKRSDKNLTTALNPEGRFIAGKFRLHTLHGSIKSVLSYSYIQTIIELTTPFNYVSATVTCRNSDTVGLTSLMHTQIRSYFVAFDRFETW